MLAKVKESDHIAKAVEIVRGRTIVATKIFFNNAFIIKPFIM